MARPIPKARPAFITGAFAVVAFALSGMLSGCAGQTQDVRLDASCGGSPLQLSWSGDIVYTDENGQEVTLPKQTLPWNAKFKAKSGQAIKLSIKGIAPFATYRIAITTGCQADDTEVVTAQTGPGGQDVACSESLSS